MGNMPLFQTTQGEKIERLEKRIAELEQWKEDAIRGFGVALSLYVQEIQEEREKLEQEQ